MATTSKQYKAIGEDIWKGRTEKVVRISAPVSVSSTRPIHVYMSVSDVCFDRMLSSSRSRTARSSYSSSRTMKTMPR